MSPLLFVHIAAGGVGIAAGAASLTLRKGSALHQAWGRAFAIAMLLMSASGFWLALGRSEPDNVIVGALTFYLVASGWLAARKRRGEPWSDAATLCAALAVVAIAATYAAQALASDDGMKNGIAAPNLLFLVAIAAAFAASDVHRAIGRRSSQRSRLLQHVWRMGFAMFIATLSLFFGQAQVLPDALRTGHANLVPIFAVLGVTIVWLVRIGRGGALRA